ncbi:lysophosphatidylserine lipase ABHD12-like [Argonauta hians]
MKKTKQNGEEDKKKENNVMNRKNSKTGNEKNNEKTAKKNGNILNQNQNQKKTEKNINEKKKIEKNVNEKKQKKKVEKAATNDKKLKGKSNSKKTTTNCNGCKSCLKSILSVLGVVLLITHGVLPILVWLLPEISNSMIFSNRLTWPPFANLSDPQYFGMEHTRSFFLKPKRNIQLGVWHTLPEYLQKSGQTFDNQQYEDSLQNSSTNIIMYLHGNSGTRACGHRVKLYQRFSNMNYHTISFDYRGFGDSTGIPFEDGVVEDSLFVYNWIKSRVPAEASVVLWGHSLGSGIATKVAKILSDNGTPPTALILESPFNNIYEATQNLPPFSLYRPFKPLTTLLLDSVERCGSEFASDKNIKDVISPILIIHAEDDGFIPMKLAVKLYQAGLETRPESSGRLEFVPFDGSHGYGHKYLHKAPNLATVFNSFLKSSTQ